MAMSEASNHPGKSPHAFMREALGVQARLRDDRQALVHAAADALARTLECGEGYPALEVDRYFATRAAGLPVAPPELCSLSGVMYAADALEDLERICAGLEAEDPTLAANSIGLIGAAVRDLDERPLLGRAAEQDLRERVISRGRTGYVALYRHLQLVGCVLIVAIRHRYASGYPRTD